MSVTIEQITKKLGFDPLNPPDRDTGNPFLVDDHTPSPYSVLTAEESNWLVKYVYEKTFKKKIPYNM